MEIGRGGKVREKNYPYICYTSLSLMWKKMILFHNSRPQQRKYIESRFDAKLNPVSWLWWGKSSIHFLIEMPIAFSFKNNQKLHKIEKRRRLAKNEINKFSGLGLVFYIHIKCTFIIKNNKSWKSWSNHHLFYSFANMRLIIMI